MAEMNGVDLTVNVIMGVTTKNGLTVNSYAGERAVLILIHERVRSVSAWRMSEWSCP